MHLPLTGRARAGACDVGVCRGCGVVVPHGGVWCPPCACLQVGVTQVGVAPAPQSSDACVTDLGAWDIDARLAALDALGLTCEPGGDAASSASVSTAVVSSADAADSYSRLGMSGLVTPRVVLAPSVFPPGRAEHMRALAERGYDRIPVDPDIPDILPQDPQPRVDVRPSSDFICRGPGLGDTCVRDGDGRVIMWPWETPNAVFAGSSQALPKQQRRAHRTDDLRFKAMNASMASGDMGRGATGVRHWRAFCASEHTPSDRPIDPQAPLWVKLEEELLAMQFCCALVEDKGLQASTVASYFGQVQGWHAKEHGIKLGAGLKLARLPAMLKGLRRVLGESGRAVRRGIAPQALRIAMDKLLSPRVPAHANIRAALAMALQGLLRSAEYACDPGVKFQSAKHLSRDDIHECSAERLVAMMLPCKNMRHLTGKTCPLVIGSGGEYVDAVREVRNMLEVDPVSRELASVTPMFRDPVTNEPLRTDMLRDLIRELMSAAGEPDPSQFGTHSLRIGGATALFAAGADPQVIRTMGRWSSDCYRLYVRACYESTVKWTRLAGSTAVSDLAGEFDEVDYY